MGSPFAFTNVMTASIGSTVTFTAIVGSTVVGIADALDDCGGSASAADAFVAGSGWALASLRNDDHARTPPAAKIAMLAPRSTPRNTLLRRGAGKEAVAISAPVENARCGLRK